MDKEKSPMYNTRLELVKLECQNCSASLEMTGKNYAFCKYCGQKYIINETVELIEAIPIDKKGSKEQVPTNKKPVSEKFTWMEVAGACLIAFVVLISVILSINKTGETIVNDRNQPTKVVSTQSTPKPNKGTAKEEVTLEKYDGFRSKVMQDAVYAMFGKGADQVTKEDLDGIRYLKVERNGFFDEPYYMISYSTRDYKEYPCNYHEKMPKYNDMITFGYREDFLDTIQTLRIPDSESGKEYIYRDMERFTNLSAIGIETCNGMDFSVFSNLSMIECASVPIHGLVSQNVAADKIEVLRCEGNTLLNLEQFTSLRKLYIEGMESDNLQMAAQLPQLDTLYCVNLKGSGGYASLKSMTGLKSLYIDGSSEGLKDLSVLADLTGLEHLAIADTDIISIDFIKNLTNLKSLRLANNGELSNFKGIGELQELEALCLDLDSLNGHQPAYAEIGRLTNLKYLYLDTVYDLDFLYKLDQLEELHIDLTFFDDLLKPISQMKNLKELTLASCHSQYEDGFACLQELERLKKLTIHGMEFKEPTDGLFGLTNVEELSITSCYFEIPPTQIAFGKNLKVLNLSNTSFDEYYSSEEAYVGDSEDSIEQGVLNRICMLDSLEELYLDYYNANNFSVVNRLYNLKKISLYSCELTDLTENYFAGCAQLEELTLSKNTISDIGFVKNLPNLKKFELTDGYVTDLTPLQQCKKLLYADVRENPIDVNPLSSKVVVIK